MNKLQGSCAESKVLYRRWHGMRSRCRITGHRDTIWYARRGISVCEEWNNDFESFRVWSLEHGFKIGLTLDRIDNEKGYCPENCRWATASEQMRNTRRTRAVVCEDGREFGSIVEAAEKLGLSAATVHAAVSGRSACAGGIVLRYADGKPPAVLHVWTTTRRRGGVARAKLVRSDGAVFENLAEAAASVRCGSRNISEALSGRQPRAGGFGWRWMAASHGEAAGFESWAVKPDVRLRAVENSDGEVFDSFVSAARAFGVSANAIRFAAKVGSRKCCGFYWRRVNAEPVKPRQLGLFNDESL